MTATESNAAPDMQSTGQWAVRWFGVVFVALLCASVPVVHIVWHVAMGNDQPIIRTRAQKDPVAASPANVLDGNWMREKERELQELSPVVWSLRGHWNELRYRSGVPQSDRVAFGKDEWLFNAGSLKPNSDGFALAKEQRLALLTQVRDLVRQSGAELLMVVLPDKARVYPDRVFPDGVMPADKASNYARILSEFDSVGIEYVDVGTPLCAARAATTSEKPTDQLYFARDTHWRPKGALIAGQVVAAAIEERFGDRLSSRQTARLNGPSTQLAVGDLTAQLGMLSRIQADAGELKRTVAMSLLTDHLAEVRQYYGVELVMGGVPVPVAGDDPQAEILVLGSSFARENGMAALSFALGRSVRANIALGAAGILPLQASLEELRSGTKAKVVVWEIVERGLFDGFWLDPKL